MYKTLWKIISKNYQNYIYRLHYTRKVLAEPLTVALESPRYAEYVVNNIGLENAV